MSRLVAGAALVFAGYAVVRVQEALSRVGQLEAGEAGSGAWFDYEGMERWSGVVNDRLDALENGSGLEAGFAKFAERYLVATAKRREEGSS